MAYGVSHILGFSFRIEASIKYVSSTRIQVRSSRGRVGQGRALQGAVAAAAAAFFIFNLSKWNGMGWAAMRLGVGTDICNLHQPEKKKK